MEKKKLEDYFIKDIEKRRDPKGIHKVFAGKIYDQYMELCKAFRCYGKFVTILDGCDYSGLYFLASPSENLLKDANPIEVLRKMKACVEPDSYYLPIFAQKLGFRPMDELDELWNYLDTVEFLTIRCKERNIKLPERINKATLFWLINPEKEQLNPRYLTEIKNGEKRIQESNYQDLKRMTELPESLMGKRKKFASDPRSLVTKLARSSKIIHFFHFIRWNNRQRVSFRILKRMGGLSGIDINKKYLKSFKRKLKKYPYILYHQDRLPYVTNLGELKGVPDEQNPWTGQIRKIVRYSFMFLTLHKPIIESIITKVIRDTEAIYHDITAEELKRRGKIVPFLLPKAAEQAFDQTFVLNDKVYAIDYNREYNEFTDRSIPILLLEKDLVFAMNYNMRTAVQLKESHTLDPVVKRMSWTVGEKTVSIDYTQNETVVDKHIQQVFERILAQKKLDERRNEISQLVGSDLRQRLKEQHHLLEELEEEDFIIDNGNTWF